MHRSHMHAAYGKEMRKLILLICLAIAASEIRADVEDHTWCRFATPDFELVTDLSPRSAHALADQMTRFERATEMLVPPQALRGPTLGIIAFRRAQDFRRVLGVRDLSGLTLPSLERYTLVFGPESGRGQSRPLTAWHGYSHYLLRSSRRMNHPAWYEQGFANFLSTMYHTKNGIVIGHIPAVDRRNMSRLKPALLDLIEGRLADSAHHDPTTHLHAWLLVHMLQLGHLAGLPEFHANVPAMLRLIDAGEPAASAVEKALGIDVAALQGLLKMYRRRRSMPTQTLAVDIVSATPPSVHCLDLRETRHMLASTAAATGNNRLADKLLKQILAQHPNDIEALVGMSGVAQEREQALVFVHRALALDANHPDANVRMAELTSDTCLRATPEQCQTIWHDSAEYYLRALRTQPDHVDAIFGLGLAYLYVERFTDAVDQLKVAHEGAPWMPHVNLFLGEAYRYIGDTARAREHLSQAMHWHFSKRWRDRAAASLALLESPPAQTNAEDPLR